MLLSILVDESFLYSNTHFSFSVKPLSVRLLEKPTTLIAGTQYSITCEAVGSRPQAKISWLRGKDEFQRGRVSSEIGFYVYYDVSLKNKTNSYFSNESFYHSRRKY
jgi:hypothetical protein